jgi:hypothetical protein
MTHTTVGLVARRSKVACALRILAIPAAPCIKMNNKNIVMCLLYSLVILPAVPWEDHFGDSQHFRQHVACSLLWSCTQTACFIWLSLTDSLWQFTYSDTICRYAWRFCWKGIPDALVFIMLCPKVGCLVASAMPFEVENHVLWQLWQDAYYLNTHNLDEEVTSHKKNANYLTGSLRASAQLHRHNTTLWFHVQECHPPLQQSIARWLHFKNIQLSRKDSVISSISEDCCCFEGWYGSTNILFYHLATEHFRLCSIQHSYVMK